MKRLYWLLGIGICALCVAAAMMPWRLGGAARRGEIQASMARATGLDVRLTGSITIKLLPSPRVRIGGVSIVSPDGSLLVEAPVVYGDLSVSALLGGHWRLASATLSEPVITADVDAGPTASALNAVQTDDFRLSIRSGVMRLRSEHPLADTLITDLDVTVRQGSSASASLALSGSAVWHGQMSQFAVNLARPRDVLAGGSSPVFVHLASAIGAVSAVGDLGGGAQQQFVGRLSVTSNALPGLFAAFGIDVPWLGVGRGTLSGDAIARYGDISLSSSELRLDDMAFEGTLGLHAEESRNLFEGTLATGLLDFGKLGGRKLDAATLAALYRARWGSDAVPADIDLRISANTARLGAVDVTDAALSALFHDGRLELTLDEAGAFGGIVKARAVATLLGDGLGARAEVALSGMALGPLSEALLGQERVSGEMTGKLALEGDGASLFDVVHGLGGSGQLTVEHGSFTGVSVSQALKRLTRKLPLSADGAGQITTFERASAAIRVERGVLNLVDGQVAGPGIKLSFDGKSDLPLGKVDIKAVAVQTDAAGSQVPNGPRLPFEIRGTWDEPLLFLERNRGMSLPLMPLPSFSPGQVLP